MHKKKPRKPETAGTGGTGRPHWVFFEALNKQHRERRDPFYMMGVFRDNWQIWRRPPPDWVMDFFAECFAKYLEAPEKAPSRLLQILGLTGDRGKKPAARATRLRQIEFHLFSKMLILNNYFDVSIGGRQGAAEMACRWLEDTHPSDWKLKRTSPETVARNYGSWRLRKEGEQFAKAQTSHWSWNRNREFINQFPKDSIPEKLQRIYLRDPAAKH